jgi:hypothetical protein
LELEIVRKAVSRLLRCSDGGALLCRKVERVLAGENQSCSDDADCECPRLEWRS